MARFVAIIFWSDRSRLLAVVLAAVTGFNLPLGAQPTMTMQAQATPPPPAPPVKMPATNAAPILPPDTLGQYGKIVVPGDQVAHPLRLKMPFPGVGEVKIPNQDEMTMRDKLEQLAKLSDQDIRTQLDKWPAYGKMSLRDQGSMLVRIQDFRDYRSNTAKMKAHDMGLLTLTPDQQAKFEKDYWDQRLLLDHELAKQFTPVYKARMQKMQDDLYREYSAVSQGPIAQGPKPVVPPPSIMSTNMAPMQPVAQAPPR